MGNVCNPGHNSTFDLQDNTANESNVAGAKQSELHRNDTAGNSTDNKEKPQIDSLKSGNPGKSENATIPGSVDQEQRASASASESASAAGGKQKGNEDGEQSTGGIQQGNDKAAVEHSEKKPGETLKPVEEQKENLVDSSEGSNQSLSTSNVLAEGAQIEKEVNQDKDEEIVALEYVIPQEKNNVDMQNISTVDNSKKQEEITSPISLEHDNKHTVEDTGRIDEAERSCLDNELVAEKKPTVEHNETAVKSSKQVTPSIVNTDNKDDNLQEQSLLNEEAELHRLENEISEKKKLVAKQNETLTQISKQKVERAKDLKNLENRVATITLQSELKERAFIVDNIGNEEKLSKTVTLNEGKLFKFGKGGLTFPKVKWIQLRLYPQGHVILDYAEPFLCAKVERNQITAVERGEKYLSGNSSSYNGRVFAVRTTSTGKHRHMVFAVESKELCGRWIESIQDAFK